MFLFIGRATGNLYRLVTFIDGGVEQSAIDVLTTLGVPEADMYAPYFPPLLSNNGNLPIVKNWVHAVDNQVYGFVTDYNTYDWRQDADVQGGVGSGLLSAGADMVCFGWFSINCYTKDTGALIWGRQSIKNAIYGDPDLWAEPGGSGSPTTVLITNLVYGKLHSLDPVTGDDMWLLNCADYEQWGIACSLEADGSGAMALSPDEEVVYFTPARNYIMAAEVFIQPTPLPTMNPTDSPIKNPTDGPTTPSPVPVPPTPTPAPSPTPPAPTPPASGSPRVGLSWLAIASMTVVLVAPFAAI